VKLRGFTLQATEARSDGDAECSGPKTVKIFVSRPHAGFAECASETPTEQFTLSPAQLAGTEVRNNNTAAKSTVPQDHAACELVLHDGSAFIVLLFFFSLIACPCDFLCLQEIKLKFVKYQNVLSVTLFFPDNQDDAPVTYLNKLDFFGQPIAGTKMQELKKIEHDH
jgi:hypothetical protein